MKIKKFDKLIDNIDQRTKTGYLNKMDRQELKQINGIGNSLACRILKYKFLYSNFDDQADLLNIPGIGASLFLNILKYSMNQANYLMGGGIK